MTEIEKGVSIKTTACLRQHRLILETCAILQRVRQSTCPHMPTKQQGYSLGTE